MIVLPDFLNLFVKVFTGINRAGIQSVPVEIKVYLSKFLFGHILIFCGFSTWQFLNRDVGDLVKIDGIINTQKCH